MTREIQRTVDDFDWRAAERQWDQRPHVGNEHQGRRRRTRDVWWPLVVAGIMALTAGAVVDVSATTPPSVDVEPSDAQQTPPGTPTATTAATTAVPSSTVEPLGTPRAELANAGMNLALVSGTASLHTSARGTDVVPVEFTTTRIGDFVPPTPVVEQRDTEAVNVWPDLEEWFRHGDGGFEHGYTLDAPMTSTSNLGIEIEVAGGELISTSDNDVVIARVGGGVVSYRDLVVVDADGDTLPSSMSVDGSTIALDIDTAGASYPITVDPDITETQRIGDFPSADSEFGTTVVVEGDLMAISAPGEITPAFPTTTGAVYLYDRTGPGDVWQSAGYIPNPAPSYGLFGQSIAISGTRIAIGAPGDSFGVADQGIVLLYDYDGGLDNWTETATVGAGGAGSYQFGWSIDYAPDGLLAIGAPGFDGGVALTEGQVFTYDGSTVTQIDPLEVPTAGVGAELGASVSIDARPGGGSRLAVGAPGDDGGSGLYRVLDDTGSGFVNVDAGTGPVGNRMGETVVVDGNRVAYNNGTDNANVQSTNDGGATWTTELIASFDRGSYSPASNLQFALEGGTFAVGQPNLNQVAIFRYDGVDWGGALALGGGVDRLLPSGSEGDDRAGWSVALDAGSLVVGAPGDDRTGDTSSDAGAVYTAEIPVVATFAGASGADTTAWNDPTNWDVGRVPGASDTAILPSAIGTVNIVGPTSPVSRLITSAGELVLSSGGRLSITGSFDGPSEIRDGVVRVNLDGGLELVADVVIDADGILATSYDALDPLQIDVTGTDSVISGNGSIQNDGGIRYSGAGTLTLDDANLNWTAGPDSVLRADTGTVDVTSAAFDWSQGTLSIGAGAVVAFDDEPVQGGLGVLEIEYDGPETEPAKFGVMQADEYRPNGTFRAILETLVTPGEVYPVIECSTVCDETGAFDSIETELSSVELGITTFPDGAGFGLVQVEDRLTAPLASSDAGFGSSIDVFGDVAIVGYRGEDRAEVLERDPGTGEWSVAQPLVGGTNFGKAVAINDGYAVVAADDGVTTYRWDGAQYGTPSFRSVDVPALDLSGQYLLYVVNGTQAQVLDITGSSIVEFGGVPAGVTSFGESVAFVDGYTVGSGQVVVGAPGEDSVVVFDAGAGAGGLGSPTTLTGPEGSSGSFGASLAASDDRIVVGEPSNDGADIDAGAVWVYDATTLTAPDRIEPDLIGDPGYEFGTDVAIVDDRIVAGAPGANPTSSLIRDGLAYAFDFDGSSWAQTEEYQAIDVYDGDEFGAAVGLATDHVLIGAPGDANAKGPDAGAIYWFGLDAPVEPAPGLTFDLDLGAGSPSTIDIASGIAISQLDRLAALGDDASSSLAVASIADIAADEPEATALASIAVGSTPLSAIVLESAPLSAIGLLDIDIDGGWERIIAGSELSNEPLASLTFGQVLASDAPTADGASPAGRFAATPLSAIEVRGTPLSAIPLSAIALGTTPLSAIPLSAIGGDWCDFVGDLVPAGSSCEASLSELTLLEAGLRGAPLSAIPLSAIPLSAIDVSTTPLSAIPLSAIELERSPLSAIPLSAIPLSAIDVEGSPLSAIPLSAIPLSAIPLSAIGPSSIDLSTVPLSAIPLSAIPLSAIPLSAIDPSGTPLSAIELARTPLSAIPLSAIVLADTPLSAIDVGDDWCDVLSAAGTSFTCESGVDPATTTLRELSVQGVPLSAIPLSAIPLSAIDVAGAPLSAIPLSAIPLSAIPLSAIPLSAIDVAGAPLSAIPLSAIDVAGSPLSAIPLSAIPLSAINCSTVNCTTGSLGDAAAAGAIVAGTTLGDIRDAATAVSLLDIATAVESFAGVSLVDALADSGLELSDVTDLSRLQLGDLPSALVSAVELAQLGSALDSITLADLLGAVLDANGAPISDAALEADLRNEVDGLGSLADLEHLGDVTLGELTDGGPALSLADVEPLLGFITVDMLQQALNIQIDVGDGVLGDLSTRDLGRLTLANLLGELDALDVASLLAGLENVLAQFTLGDLLLALVDPGSLALGGADFTRVDVGALPAGVLSPTTFDSVFELSSSRQRTIELSMRLPAGASFGGSSTLSDGVTTTDTAPVVDGHTLRWTVQAEPDTSYTLSFDVLPALRLGATSVTGTARVVGTDVSIPASTQLTIAEGGEPNDFPETVLADDDTMYLTYIADESDIDVFEIEVAENDRLFVELANLDANLDMVLWGDPDNVAEDAALARTSNDAPLTPVTDPDADGADAEPLDDFVRLDAIDPDLNLLQVSNRRNTRSEGFATDRLPAGTYYVQVYGANGVSNVSPATLQFKVQEAETRPECVVAGSLPVVSPGTATAVPDDANTLILVNESRLEQFHGADARIDVMGALGRLADHLQDDPTINPVVVSVDGNQTVTDAYAAWDTDAGCTPSTANGVVAAINSEIIDPVRDQLDHIVFVGGDEQIPMARLKDSTLVANEYDYRHEFDGDLAGTTPDGRNALSSSFWESRILSDEPYGDDDARSLGDRYLYVTDVALGRLVETPDDIVDTLDTFVDFDGTLAIDTAAVLGYDFLSDGSAAIAETLQAELPTGTTVDAELAEGVGSDGQPWDRDDATQKLIEAGTNALVSLNAHFDHYRSLPAIGDKVPGFDDNLIATEVADQLGADALAQSLIFSMGCHSGLSVSDVTIAGTNADWAQSLAGLGATYVGNTGFGYGDTESVAYTEQLMSLFARNVTTPFEAGNNSTTVGQALAWAKNDYVGGLQTFSVYDEKAVMESTFYGLPFYRVGLPTDALPPAPDNSVAAGQLDGGVDITADNEERNTPSGTYYANIGPDGDDQVIVAPGQPIQPKITVDVSVVDPGDTTVLAETAHGAIVEEMTSRYVSANDPVVATPVYDESAGRPEPSAIDAIFPSKPLDITKVTGPAGNRQQLVVATGQYDGTRDRQRLDDQLSLSVFYSDADDFSPPTIGSVSSALQGGRLDVELTANDASGVQRVYVLIAPNPGVGTVEWVGLDLAASGGRWSGSIDLGASVTEVEFIVQALDGAGNVGLATAGGANFGDSVTNTPPTDPPAGELTAGPSAQALPSGWYDGPVTIEVDSSSPASVSIDGAAPTPVSNSFEISDSGVHRWVVTNGDGITRSGTVRIDGDGPPTIEIISPADGSSGPPRGGRVNARCSDVSPAPCRIRLDGVLIPSGTPIPTAPGQYTLTVSSTDAVGNTADATSTFTVTALQGAPRIRDVQLPSVPQQISEPVEVSVEFTDVSGATDDYTLEIDWGDGEVTTEAVQPAQEPSAQSVGTAEASHVYSAPGVYAITVEVSDGTASDTDEAPFVVIFDPESTGRVAGAGLFHSGADSYAGSSRWGSLATFGYTARYKAGDDVPSGSTQLRLIGEFLFSSSAYDYLIVNDAMAVAEGVGTVGGEEYRFRVQGVDNGWVDYFQITIWDETSGDVFYDNGVIFDDGDRVLLGGIRIRE